MRRDASDALKYGCTGLMGIHWRTRILGPNVSALAKAAWDQTGWKGQATSAADGKLSHICPIADFYADWARAEFGPEAAEPIAAIFTRLDGHLPRPADWVTGPGSIRPDHALGRSAEGLRLCRRVGGFAAADQHGPGNLERFDYWLNNFRCLRSIGQGAVRLGPVQRGAGQAPRPKRTRRRKRSSPASWSCRCGRNLVAAFAELHRHLLATVTNPGEMGNVCNWQQQTLPVLLTEPGQELAKLLGEDLPADAMPSKQYAGQPRLFVPEVRTGIVAGETLQPDGDRAGGTPENGHLLAAAGRGRVCHGAAGARGPRRLYGHAAGRGRQRRFRVLRRSHGRRQVARVSADRPGAEPDGRRVRAMSET